MIFAVSYQNTLPKGVDCIINHTIFENNVAIIKSDYDSITSGQLIITSTTSLNPKGLSVLD